jgi:tetratricopeptide (TPR) repeat protein
VDRSLKILLSILTVFLLNHTSHASEVFYTIQTGTYVHDALGYAGRQFNLLSQKLNENDRAFLRIEEGNKYFVVRLGRFKDIDIAKKVLETVKTLASDAFILKETDFEHAKVLIFYENDKKQAKTYISQRDTKVNENVIAKSPDEYRDDKAISMKDKIASPSARNDRLGVFSGEPADKKEFNKLIDDVSNNFYNQEYGKAGELLRKGLARWPDDPNLHGWYGAILLSTGSPDKAYEEYQKAAELLPDVPEFHAGVGHSLLNIYIDRAQRSIAAFKKALALDPNNVSALEGLGIIYVSIDKKHLAREIYDRLQKIDQNAAERLNQFILWGLDWGDIVK